MGYDVEKMIQIFRRIYKTPEEVQIEVLLDVFMVMALSGYPIDFKNDPKSKKFVKDSLLHIDDYFKGQKSYAVNENLSLNYYSSIESENKKFNKTMTRKNLESLDNFDYNIAEDSNSIEVFEKKEKKSNEPQVQELYAEQEEIISQEYTENIDIENGVEEEAAETIDDMMGIVSDSEDDLDDEE